MQAHLEHEDGAAEEGAVQEELEDEGRGDLVRHVGHAHVKERQVGLDRISDEHLQFRLKQMIILVGKPLQNIMFIRLHT